MASKRPKRPFSRNIGPLRFRLSRLKNGEVVFESGANGIGVAKRMSKLEARRLVEKMVRGVEKGMRRALRDLAAALRWLK